LLPLGSLADLPALGFSNSKSGCSHPIRCLPLAKNIRAFKPTKTCPSSIILAWSLREERISK
ncbi:hypothetical protein S83_054902, partial [Arachis hypogaea]